MEGSRRKNVIAEAQAWLAEQPVYLDTETTGMQDKDEVIEIGVVDDNGITLLESFVRPRLKIDLVAADVHEITPEMLASAPTWDKIWPKLEAVLVGRRVGVYNKEFDLRIMRQSHTHSWMRWTFPEDNFFDIMELYARFIGERGDVPGKFKNHSLELAGKQCGTLLPNSHRAVDDCLLARAVLHCIAESD